MPPTHRASASDLRVTEAGCASKATRLPLRGARKAGSAISRSMPNFMAAPEKTHAQNSPHDGSPAFRVDAPTPNMTYGRSSLRSPPTNRDATRLTWQARQAIQLQRGLQCVAIGIHRTSIEGALISAATLPASVTAEPICRPLRRRRKIEFVILGARRSADKCLESRCAAKARRRARPPRRRYANFADLAGHELGQHQAIGARTREFPLRSVSPDETKRVRMASQRAGACRHSTGSDHCVVTRCAQGRSAPQPCRAQSSRHSVSFIR